MPRFKIFLDADFKSGDLLTYETKDSEIKVISVVNRVNSEWYKRLINFLSFGKFFKIDYSYIVKLMEDEEN